MILAIGAALVAALVIRQSTSRETLRRLALVAVAAFGVRLLAVLALYLIAIQSHAEGTLFNDEASFYLAAEALLPNPLDKPLPGGLDHLGTDAYLGILTWFSVALGSSHGHMDTVAFRLLNATLGSLAAVTTTLVAWQLAGKRAALIAGLGVALWPTLVLWSASFLRDTMASFIIVVTWWTLVSHRDWRNVRVMCMVVLALSLLSTLRPYLAGAVLVGLVGWLVWPLFAARSRGFLAVSAAVVVVACAGLWVLEAKHIDEAAHAVVYRQLTTRMETMGRLYHDPVPGEAPQEPPFGSGAAVALVDPTSHWIAPGLVEQPLGPGLVRVGFMDGSEQDLRISELVLLQSAPLSPVQLLTSIGPGLVSFLSGTSLAGDPGSPGWTADALAWDTLLVLAVVGGIRARVPLREWILPACIVLGTAAALIAVPGAPGNDDRHRSSQAIPLLLVFAAGCLVSRSRPSSTGDDGLAVSSATSMPMSAGTAAASDSRSPR